MLNFVLYGCITGKPYPSDCLGKRSCSKGLYDELVRNNSAFKGPRRNSWSRRHRLSPCLGKEGAAVPAHGAGDLRAAAWVTVTDLRSELPLLLVPLLPLSSIAWLMLQLSPASAPAACFHVPSCAALGTLDPNHAAAEARRETATQDPFTNPWASFTPRCKFRVGDAWRAKLAYSFLCFPKGHEDGGLLRTMPPGSERGALLSPWMPCLESLMHSSGLSFSGLGCICCACRGKHKLGGEWLYFQCKRQWYGGRFSKGQ